MIPYESTNNFVRQKFLLLKYQELLPFLVKNPTKKKFIFFLVLSYKTVTSNSDIDNFDTVDSDTDATHICEVDTVDTDTYITETDYTVAFGTPTYSNTATTDTADANTYDIDKYNTNTLETYKGDIDSSDTATNLGECSPLPTCHMGGTCHMSEVYVLYIYILQSGIPNCCITFKI